MKLFIFIILLIFFPGYILGGLLAIALALYLADLADLGPIANAVCQMLLGVTIAIACIIGFYFSIFDERLDLYKTNKADFISIVDLLFSKTTLSIICLVMFFVMVVFTINKIKKLKRLSIDRNY